MDYEKKYKDVLKRLEPYFRGGYDMTTPTKELLISLFPELAESEDEKIRKHLVCLFKNEYGENSSSRFAGVKVKDILAWLEKQRKVTPQEPFKIGDIVTNGYYEGMVVGTAYEHGWFTVKCDRSNPPVFPVLALHYDAWHKVDDKIEAVEKEIEKYEERLGITKKEFEEELKHLYKYADEVQYTRGYDKGVEDAEKSFEEQKQWKPSEEQIEALRNTVDGLEKLHSISVGGYSSYPILKSLLEQLKALV